MKKKSKARQELLKAWNALSKEIRQNERKCAVCGSVKGLNVHHILHKRTRPDLYLEKRNLICLCRSCHFSLHKGNEVQFLTWLRLKRPAQYAFIMEEAEKNNRFLE